MMRSEFHPNFKSFTFSIIIDNVSGVGKRKDRGKNGKKEERNQGKEEGRKTALKKY